MRKRMTRREMLRYAGLGGSTIILAACQPKVVEKIVKETVEVEKVVEKEVEVEKEVTRVVEKVVESEPAPQEKVTLRFMSRAGIYGDYQREASRRFEQKNPHVTVKNEDASWDDLMKKVLVQAVAGVLPDVAWQWISAWAPYLVTQGVWMSLDDLISADNFPMSVFYPYAIDACTIGGHVIGLPLDAHPGHNMIYYNVDVFEEAGAKEPDPEGNWSWEEYTNELLKIKENTDVWPVDRPVSGIVEATWYRSWKGDIIDRETGTKCVWSADESQQAFKHLYDRIHTWEITPGQGQIEGDSAKMFAAGRLAAWESHPTQLGVLRSSVGDKFRWGQALIPKLPSGVIGSVASTCGVHISANSQHAQEAWGLLKEITNLEMTIWNVVHTGKQPAPRIDAWHHPEILAQWDGFRLAGKLLDEGVEKFPMPANTRLTEFFDVFDQEVSAIVYGNKPYDQASVDGLTTKCQQVLDMPMP